MTDFDMSVFAALRLRVFVRNGVYYVIDDETTKSAMFESSGVRNKWAPDETLDYGRGVPLWDVPFNVALAIHEWRRA